MITPAVREIKLKTEQHFEAGFHAGTYVDLGVYNRRPIAGTSTWSQHAWGNAWDIGVKGPKLMGDQLVDYLRTEDRAGRLSVGTILWQVKDHFDHVHVEGDPKKTGVPPIPGPEEDDMETTKGIQRVLNANGYKGKDGKALVVDGIWGANTEFALNLMVADAKRSLKTLPAHGHSGTASVK